jgi:hypothetical protein
MICLPNPAVRCRTEHPVHVAMGRRTFLELANCQQQLRNGRNLACGE